jgi:hypothetical protein
MEDLDLQNAILFADASRGIYIPQYFAKTLVDDAEVEFIYHGIYHWDTVKPILLDGPDHPEYDEAWEFVLDNARVHHRGKVYSLYQDGDLWLVPESN